MRSLILALMNGRMSAMLRGAQINTSQHRDR